VDNRTARTEQVEAHFRVGGREPELWNAETGQIEPVSYRQEGSQTVIPLTLGPNDAEFAVFTSPVRSAERNVPQPKRKALRVLKGPWVVHFQADRGAPEQATFLDLKSWSASAESGIRYFSGTASYETRLEAPPSWLKDGARIELDLGSVKSLAEVLVNGRSAGILWKPPFRADVTTLLRAGANSLTIKVTNLWVNRLIGDKQPQAKPVTSTTFNPYSADSPLIDSGLLGPVTVSRVMR
jgi:hypothetical protein